MDNQFQQFERDFSTVYRKIASEYSKTHTGGVSGSQYFLLQMLGEGPKTGIEIADTLGVTLPAVTSMTKKLAANGYIKQVRSDVDRRYVFNHLTEEGKTQLDLMHKDGLHILTRMIRSLTEEEFKQLTEIYHKMSARFQE
ncbi:MarR family transcriptional regulator [Paenibacillus sp. N1-5-1-14]|uniref:MarR family winged helix-turn-helix transcriptional regulator n=1 Tax=Paenibacillus radicibacter TaxID=2972488 RepID=UPI002158D255|nr:MarR family transcriptional regulator [Paenibacillus radicibacter]MCR8641312.1 MarR family transcriptional regulator [Paenibacillus radicibacter]